MRQLRLDKTAETTETDEMTDLMRRLRLDEMTET